jgi:hypothetical protein
LLLEPFAVHLSTLNVITLRAVMEQVDYVLLTKESQMELFVTILSSAQEMTNAQMVFVQDLEVVFVVMVTFLHLLKIVNLQALDVVTQLAISPSRLLCAGKNVRKFVINL